MNDPSGSTGSGRGTAAVDETAGRPVGLLAVAPLLLLLILPAVAGAATPRSPGPAEQAAALAAAALTLGQNLIANPGAEDGASVISGLDVVTDIPGWTRAGDATVVNYATKPGRWPTGDDPGPVDRGAAFFTGGPQEPVDSLIQVVDVSALACAIDAGAMKFDLAAYLGGVSSSEDNVAVQARFLDASNALLDAATIGPVTAGDRDGQTGLLLRVAWGALPARTRTAVVTMTFTGTSGQNCWGLADSIGLSVTQVSAADVPWPAAPEGLRLAVGPDPAVSDAHVTFTLPVTGAVRVEVLDVTGRRVALLADDARPAGQYELGWLPRRSGVGAGVYFVRLATSSGALVRKLVVLAR